MNGRATFLWFVAAMIIAPAISNAGDREPVRIIFDTDMDSDCDDVAALAMLHALADAGEIELLGVMISAGNEWSAPCTDAINTYFHRPDIPIGVPAKPGPIVQDSKYARAIAEKFPHDMPPRDKRTSAVELYRKLLTAQPDRSVTIVSVGDLTNLAQLLESLDSFAAKKQGRDLVAQKVANWVCMGSRYPADLDPAKWGNFKMDPESTVKAIEGWPTLVTFTGGGKFAESLATGAKLKELPDDSPVRRGYELYFGGAAKNRHSADQIAVLVAARGTGKPWKLVRDGHNHIFSDGRHEWRTDSDDANQQYISALADGEEAREVAAEIEKLMLHLPREKKD